MQDSENSEQLLNANREGFLELLSTFASLELREIELYDNKSV